MVNRVIRRIPVIALVLAPHFAVTAAAQPKNHIGEQMANILIAGGCAMPEGEIYDTMMAQGLHISDFQAQAMALDRGGHLTKDADDKLRLNKWPPCT